MFFCDQGREHRRPTSTARIEEHRAVEELRAEKPDEGAAAAEDPGGGAAEEPGGGASWP